MFTRPGVCCPPALSALLAPYEPPLARGFFSARSVGDGLGGEDRRQWTTRRCALGPSLQHLWPEGLIDNVTEGPKPRCRRRMGTSDVRPWFSLVSRTNAMPKPNDDLAHSEPPPVRPPTLPPDFPDISQNPSSELQPPSDPSAIPDGCGHNACSGRPGAAHRA